MNFDLKTPFLSALAQDGAINEPAMSTELLGGAFAPLERRVKDSLEKQESLVAAIQQNSDEYFGREKGGDGSQREQLMRQLAEGFDAFTDLQNNIREGTKFYNDLTQVSTTAVSFSSITTTSLIICFTDFICSTLSSY